MSGLGSSDDLRVGKMSALIPAACILEDLPLSEASWATISSSRSKVDAVVRNQDDRIIVVVGPCSIHNVDAAIEYANLLKGQVDKYQDTLVILMRTYFEKPRTTVGWKGLVNDPDLDNTFKINKGIKIARQLLLDITALGVGVSAEFLDTISPQYFSDLFSWGAIGARTTECQLHRELASGISCAVGFKNGTTGDVQIAADAIKSSLHPHHFIGVTKQGTCAVVSTKGNDCCHLILRGGKTPNYSAQHIADASAVLAKSGIAPRIMVDCSHGNSSKNHNNQPIVNSDVAQQISAGDKSIIGVMIESNINEGRQDLTAAGPSALKYGVSITDACVNWETTVTMLEVLSQAVVARRAAAAASK